MRLMISGKQLRLMSIAISMLMLTVAVMLFRGTDLVVAWVVGSFVLILKRYNDCLHHLGFSALFSSTQTTSAR